MVTIVDGSVITLVDGEAAPTTVLLAPAALEDATGWDLRPEGLCRGDVCVPRRAGDGLVVDGRIDLAAFAASMRRPLAYDANAGIAVLADSPDDHAAAFDERVAPSFTLPDLDGNLVSSSEFAGQKKLLLAWASW
jgi:hypothetical protein